MLQACVSAAERRPLLRWNSHNRGIDRKRGKHPSTRSMAPWSGFHDRQRRAGRWCGLFGWHDDPPRRWCRRSWIFARGLTPWRQSLLERDLRLPGEAPPAPSAGTCRGNARLGPLDDQLALELGEPAKIAKTSGPLAVVVSIDAPSPACPFSPMPRFVRSPTRLTRWRRSRPSLWPGVLSRSSAQLRTLQACLQAG